jgi:hypothetical protein
MGLVFVIDQVGWRSVSVPNNACTRQVGFCAFFKPVPGFEFFPLPIRVSPRPLAGNASRWVATCGTVSRFMVMKKRSVNQQSS